MFRDDRGRQRKRSAATLAEARAIKSAVTADLVRGEYVQESRLRFAEYAREWVAGYFSLRPIDPMLQPYHPAPCGPGFLFSASPPQSVEAADRCRAPTREPGAIRECGPRTRPACDLFCATDG